MTTLAEISGLLVLLKVISLFFSFIHQSLFDRELRKFEEVGERNYKEVFTYSNFKQALNDIETLKEKYIRLELKYK